MKSSRRTQVDAAQGDDYPLPHLDRRSREQSPVRSSASNKMEELTVQFVDNSGLEGFVGRGSHTRFSRSGGVQPVDSYSKMAVGYRLSAGFALLHRGSYNKEGWE